MANGSLLRRRRSSKGESRRAAMLAAARRVFLARGFAAATLDDVIAESGGSRATLYAGFGGKEGLFAAIIEGLCADILSALPAVSGEDDPEAVLAALGRAYMNVLMAPESLALYRMVIAEAGRTPKLGMRVFRAGPAEAVERLSDYLTGEVARGRLAIDDCALAASQFLEMVKGDLHLRALFGGRHPRRAEMDACVTAAARIFCDGVRARP